MIDDFQVMLTWEGDNHVLIHQAAKFILKGIFRVLSNRPVTFKTLEYLTMDDPADLFAMSVEQFEQALASQEVLGRLMAFRAKAAATSAGLTFQANLTEIVDSFPAWNKSVPFGFLDATVYFGELYIYRTAVQGCRSHTEPAEHAMLHSLLAIFALTRVLKSWAHVGGHFQREHVEAIQRQLLGHYGAIKHDLVRLVDGFALTDDFANSPFGCEDGDMYGRLFAKLNSDKENFGKPPQMKQIWDNRFSY